MTKKEKLEKAATRLGYKLVKIKPHCRTCKYLNGEKIPLGIACTNPEKNWRTNTAQFRQPSTPACKMYIEKEGEAHEKESTCIS